MIPRLQDYDVENEKRVAIAMWTDSASSAANVVAASKYDVEVVVRRSAVVLMRLTATFISYYQMSPRLNAISHQCSWAIKLSSD